MKPNTKNLSLPVWALQKENYEPQCDREDFISRSLLRIISVLSDIRLQGMRKSPVHFSAAASLAFALLIVLLCAASHNLIFLLYALALELTLLCLLDGKTIISVLKRSALTATFSLLLIMPALLLGSSAIILFIPAKTFLTVTAVYLLTDFFPWHKLTGAFRGFRLPEIFIFILDTTLRYIMLLGETAKNLLVALKLRSVGKNRQKSSAIAGILGVTFIRSKEMSEEMYMAMRCRCFTGEYMRPLKTKWQSGDIAILILSSLSILMFIVSEGVI